MKEELNRQLITTCGELDQVAREDTVQTWHAQMSSVGVLGTSSRGPGPRDLQRTPLAELQQHSEGDCGH